MPEATTREAFDVRHPPVQALIDECVHCGFCLPSCPTYLLFGEEMDSPRGRIHLMRQRLEGEPLTDAMVRHFDLCLGCLACTTACPSGVRYEQLIESTRHQVERGYERPRGDRYLRGILFRLFPYPRRLRLLAAGLRPYRWSGLRRLLRALATRGMLPPRLRALVELSPPEPPAGPDARHATFTPASGPRRRVVGLLTGCVQRVFFPQVNAATVRTLVAEGCDVHAPAGQGCCGALSLHAGRDEEAREFARRMIDAFERVGVENVVVNAAGCGSAMKEYGRLLRDDPGYAQRAADFSARVRDASELLCEMEPRAPRHPLPVVAAYHDACHLAHGQGIRDQPRALLKGIPGLELKAIAESEICCGSAGIYNLLEPEPAARLGERKAEHILRTGAQLVVTANPGCLLQLRAALERKDTAVALAHPMEVLDASIRGEGGGLMGRGSGGGAVSGAG